MSKEDDWRATASDIYRILTTEGKRWNYTGIENHHSCAHDKFVVSHFNGVLTKLKYKLVICFELQYMRLLSLPLLFNAHVYTYNQHESHLLALFHRERAGSPVCVSFSQVSALLYQYSTITLCINYSLPPPIRPDQIDFLFHGFIPRSSDPAGR